MSHFTITVASMRVLPYFILFAVAVAAYFWWTDRRSQDNQHRMALRSAQPIAVDDGIWEGTCWCAYGALRGPGRLRITPTQVVFLANSGDVQLVDRSEISGLGLTNELPDRLSPTPVIAIKAATNLYYFSVTEPAEVLRRLSGD